MRLLTLVPLFVTGAAIAQDQAVQRALIQRNQQSEAFSLQLRQSLEAARVPPASRPAVESLQLWDRQRLENLNEKQLIEVRPETPDALRPYERQKLEAERIPFRSPIIEVPVQRPAPPPPLQPSLKGNVDLIEAPR